MFEIIATDGQARASRLTLHRGVCEGPFFMPVGTRGAARGITHPQLKEVGTQLLLANTYHLWLRPGHTNIAAFGGLPDFIGWDRPMLTDSGGFQVFSLAHLNTVTDSGVHFRSHIDGSKLFLTPTLSMEIQKALGADIVMAFDECPPYPCSERHLAQALARTTLWAQMCSAFPLHPFQKKFGIIQGGIDSVARLQSLEAITALPFDGYALGGLSVGEPTEAMVRVFQEIVPRMPEEKPRYVMGVGTPLDIVEAVATGVDMFDCVLPTRNGRNGTAFTWQGKLSIKSARYKEDATPLDPECASYPSGLSRRYLRHLLKVGEWNGSLLLAWHNVAFYHDFMKKMRDAIVGGYFQQFRQDIHQRYRAP